MVKKAYDPSEPEIPYGQPHIMGTGAGGSEYVANPDYGDFSTPSEGEWEWDTPQEVYEFGRQRLNQMIDQLRKVGAEPVAKRPDYRSELGGQLKGWQSYQAALGLAQARYEQQMDALRLNLKYLEERMRYQHPISDLM